MVQASWSHHRHFDGNSHHRSSSIVALLLTLSATAQRPSPQTLLRCLESNLLSMESHNSHLLSHKSQTSKRATFGVHDRQERPRPLERVRISPSPLSPNLVCCSSFLWVPAPRPRNLGQRGMAPQLATAAGARAFGRVTRLRHNQPTARTCATRCATRSTGAARLRRSHGYEIGRQTFGSPTSEAWNCSVGPVWISLYSQCFADSTEQDNGRRGA